MKISIITPSFNQGKFIRRTLDGVLARQDFENIEHIVVDGCSNDVTLEILKEYKRRYPAKFSYIYEKDIGQSNAINKGFKRSTGYIVGWINSDDYYEDNIFRFVADYFQNNPEVDMIYGGCNRVNENGEFTGKFEENYGFRKCKINNFETFNYDTLLNVYSGLIPQPSVFFRKKIFDEVGFLDESYNFTMDYEYWLRIGAKCKIVRLNKVLANFRSQPDAKTNFRNRFDFIRESSRARSKYGGRRISFFHLYNGLIVIKTLLKFGLLRLNIIKD